MAEVEVVEGEEEPEDVGGGFFLFAGSINLHGVVPLFLGEGGEARYFFFGQDVSSRHSFSFRRGGSSFSWRSIWRGPVWLLRVRLL